MSNDSVSIANQARYMMLRNANNSMSHMYGPGVLNDTIVPGYGVTKFPVNLDTFWSLPNRTIRAFGEANQYVTYPEGRPQWMYQLAQNFTSPNHISQWDPMLLSLGGIPNQETTNPYLTEAGRVRAFNSGFNMVQQMNIKQGVQGIASALNSMENSLANVIKSDKLTKAQKAELKGLLEEVKALKTKIEQQLKAKNPTMEEVVAMQKEVQNLQKKVSDTASKINGQVAGSQGSEGSEGSNSSTGSSASSDADDAELLSDSKYKDINPKTGKPASLTDPAEGEAELFCAQIDKAIKHAGTDDDALKAILLGITSSNVIEIVNQWKDTRRGNLFGELLDDLNDGEQQELIPIILNALKDRASALGIYDEIKVEYSKVNQELAEKRNCINFFWGGGQDDSVIEANLLAICKKIEAKEKENKEGAAKVIKEKKADNKKKVEGRKKEVINEKKNEISNRLKEELKLKEVPQLSTALKIETDEDGEFTGYSIELNTQNGKIKVTGQTYQELALAIEKNNLEVGDVLIRKTQA